MAAARVQPGSSPRAFPSQFWSLSLSFCLGTSDRDLPYEFCQAPLAKLVPGMEYKRKNNFLTADLCVDEGSWEGWDPPDHSPGWGANSWGWTMVSMGGSTWAGRSGLWPPAGGGKRRQEMQTPLHVSLCIPSWVGGGSKQGGSAATGSAHADNGAFVLHEPLPLLTQGFFLGAP